ncbi:FlhC family transcriptional regulator [Pseudorhodoferax soli]|uniref:Transcriptional activator FlhC n=1 Tax=Pseudorhodoferax soli TaxID=545864 RepID=A0A368XBL2_9BURK|nr:FlhC family transcriptional regulator [Pseudorhodoferax soli]RCW65109.1 transcriptional activator FlhC [Pseudorhodoferax soli]
MPIGSSITVKVHALSLAQDCALLGARVRTIQYLTGLPAFELLRMLFSARHPAPRGRTPDSREWYHRANLLHRVEASVVIGSFTRMRVAGFAPADALVAAYQDYRTLYSRHCRISFDRAFDLAAHTSALWITCTRSFHMVRCGRCGCEAIDAASLRRSGPSSCPFCDLLQRLDRDPRLAASLKVHVPPCPEAWIRELAPGTQTSDGQ